MSSNFQEKLNSFLQDPIEKCFEIRGHKERAKKYAEKLGISNIEEKGTDHIASCMERSLLPKKELYKEKGEEYFYQDFKQICHPLCDRKVDREKEKINVDEVFAKVGEVFYDLGNKIKNYNDREKFFYLWRNLQDKIFEKYKNEPWAKYLPVLPADTRIPDHSIWEHLKIASAINAGYDEQNKILIQDNSLFLFTIGPVQSFISQARKTQDFYMGSFILSYLTFKAMEVIIDECGPTNIIYPDLYKQPLTDMWIKNNLDIDPIDFKEKYILLPTIPNRFVAILPTTDKGEIKNLVDKIKDKIKDEIKKSKETILKYFSEGNKEIENQVNKADDKINSQFSEFPETYWIAVPWRINGKDISFDGRIDDLKEFFDENLIKQYEDLWNFAKTHAEFPPNIGLLYELLYSALEKSMGARKNVRNFKQLDSEEKGRKCSVCGERDVIFFRDSKEKELKKEGKKGKFTRFNSFTVDLTDKISPKYLQDGEGLCAICFLKRTFEIYLGKEVSNVFKGLSFPSTAEVAIADWKEWAIDNAKSEFIEYTKKLKGILGEEKFNQHLTDPLPKLKNKFGDIKNPDGQFFYEENITSRYFERNLRIEVDENSIIELKDLLKKIYKKAGEPNYSYYTIIHLDGDNMGKWLSGELLPKIECAYNSETWKNLPDGFKQQLTKILPRKLLTPAIHASISTALRNYALEFVRKIVEEEHLGKLVYAGGDDVLAFVNLKDLFDVMRKLRWAFSGHIEINNNGQIEVNINNNNNSGFVEKDGKYLLTMGKNATASMGVVIAHYKAPLQIVIKKVFEMEELVKDPKILKKDAFAICFMRRSGEERVFKAKWKYDEKDTIELLKELVKYFDENEQYYISKSFINKIADEFKYLKNEEGKFIATADIFNKELMRILGRCFNTKVKMKQKEKKENLNTIYEDMKESFWDTGGNINYFLNACIIASFISKTGD